MATSTILSVVSKYGLHQTTDLDTSPLQIIVSNFDTTVDASALTWTIVQQTVSGEQFDAQVIVTMKYSDAIKAFSYVSDNSGETVLTFDSSCFNINYPYLAKYASVSLTTDAPAINLTNVASGNLNSNELYNNLNTHAYGSLKWNGFVNCSPTTATTKMRDGTTFDVNPLSSNNVKLPMDNLGDSGVSSNQFVPMSWDYIFYTSRQIFGTYASYTFFDNLYAQEKTLQDNIDSAINTKVSASLTSGSVSLEHSTLTPSGSTQNTQSIIFNNLLKYRPERFVNRHKVDQTYGYPFYPQDTLGFSVKITPDSNQQYIGQTDPIRTKSRTYYMTILIDDDKYVTDLSNDTFVAMERTAALNTDIPLVNGLYSDLSNDLINYTNAVNAYSEIDPNDSMASTLLTDKKNTLTQLNNSYESLKYTATSGTAYYDLSGHIGSAQAAAKHMLIKINDLGDSKITFTNYCTQSTVPSNLLATQCKTPAISIGSPVYDLALSELVAQWTTATTLRSNVDVLLAAANTYKTANPIPT